MKIKSCFTFLMIQSFLSVIEFVSIHVKTFFHVLIYCKIFNMYIQNNLSL